MPITSPDVFPIHRLSRDTPPHLNRPLNTGGLRVSGTIALRKNGKTPLPEDARLIRCPICGLVTLLTRATSVGTLVRHPHNIVGAGRRVFAFSFGAMTILGDDVSIVEAVCPETDKGG